MQSKFMSWVECVVKTFVTGSAAVLANYFLLPLFWNLPPTLWDSITMAVWFALQSVVLSYPIRRWFNRAWKGPDAEFLQILYRQGDDTATLSIVADGKNHSFRINLRRVSYMVQSGAEALREMVASSHHPT